MTFKEIERLSSERTKNKVKCKCSHTIFFPYFVDKKVCNWCGYYVYRTKEIEFREKLSDMMKKIC